MTYLKAGVRPHAELHVAVLNVKRKELDFHLAEALEDNGRFPPHSARVGQCSLCHDGHREVAISTAGDNDQCEPNGDIIASLGCLPCKTRLVSDPVSEMRELTMIDFASHGCISRENNTSTPTPIGSRTHGSLETLYNDRFGS